MTQFFKNHKKIKYFILPVMAATVLMLVIPSPIMAADSYKCKEGEIVLQVPIPVPGIQNDFCVKGFPEYVQRLYNFFISVVGILAVIMMMYGGFQWLIAGGNPTKISGAKATVLSALAGLALTLSSYLILSLINPDLTKFSLDISKYKVERVDLYSGFCTRDSKVKEVSRPEDMKCGTKYTLIGEENVSCRGINCEEPYTLEREIVTGSTAANICFGSVDDFCSSEVVLDEAKSAGYSDIDIKAGIFVAGGKSPLVRMFNDFIVSGSDNLECGKIYYRPMSLGFESGLYVGAYCKNGGSCVIKNPFDYNITKNKAETSPGVANNLVGEFTSAYCL